LEMQLNPDRPTIPLIDFQRGPFSLFGRGKK
jgi:hypothetical protein